MTSTSFWLEVPRQSYAPVSADAQYDVVVVGGGITGLTAAWYIKQAGKSVCVLEKQQVGGGETGHTSAHLAYTTDARLTELVKRFGDDGARLAWEAGITAIDAIESIVTTHGIDCQFSRVPGYLHPAIYGNEDESDSLQAEAAEAQRLGLPGEFLPLGPDDELPAVRYDGQALIHPVQYLMGLARLVQGDGCDVHEKSEVTEVGDDMTLVVNGHKIRCDKLILATNVPLTGHASLLRAMLFQTKIYPYSSYVVGAHIPLGALPHGLYYDTSDPYYYLRVGPDGTGGYAVFGGADHKTGQTEDTESRFTDVETTLYELLPGASIDHRWSGQVVETSDGLPYIGETAPNQFAATGYAGNGLTFGTVSGIMARDYVMGIDNPWQKLFSPHRTSVLHGAWDYVVENIDYPYHLLTGWLKEGREDPALRTLKPGEGRVINRHGHRIACHRSENGELSQVSAVCTHLGCLVRFNQAEQTWDCPCHGSRFLPDGEVIGGPAEKPLPPAGKRAAAH